MARRIRINKKKRIALVTSVALAIVASPLSIAQASESAPDAGRPFHAQVGSEKLYDIKRPTEDPAVQTVRLQVDGAELFMETFLPAPKNGNVPPQRIPTILVVAPGDLLADNNANLDDRGMQSPFTLRQFVPRGYAWSQLHVRGTGESTGCFNLLTQEQADDAAAAIEYLGTKAPWSNGVVGGFGFSGTGGAILNAALRGDPEKTQYLKALEVGNPQIDYYSTLWMIDGVASTMWTPVATTYINAENLLFESDQQRWAGRQPCFAENSSEYIFQQSNDFAPFFQERDLRGWVHQLDTPIMMFHGHPDLYPAGGAPPINQAGFFEQIPPSTPKIGVFGIFGHDYPSEGPEFGRKIGVEWARSDYDDMRVAWMDHWLKGIGSNIQQWPAAHVQGNDGQWRGEADWPFTGGPVGQLALGPAGDLGATAPEGATRYREATYETYQGRVPDTYRVFETEVDERLEITGQPVLDLWVELDLPDSHIAARIETFDANGEPIPYGMTYGMRSAQHIAPLENNRFVQEKGQPAPIDEPINIQVRFQPTDLVVPAGGTIRVTVAGSLRISPGLSMTEVVEDPVLGDPTQWSGSPTGVTILHDCEHPSALRFLMPRTDPDLMNVREWDETEVRANPGPAPISDGGGIATDPVCGQAPIRLPNFGPETEYQAPAGGVTKAPR